MAANVLRDRGGDLQIEEAMLPAAAVPGGLREEVLEAWDARADVSRQRDFRGSDGVGASQVVTVRAFETEIVHKPRLSLANLAAESDHAEDDELVTRGGVPPVVIARLFLCAVELLNQGGVDLLMSVVKVLNARRFHVSWFQANVVGKDRREALEAVF